MSQPPHPVRREVTLEPALQARLLEQMREEQAARMRSKSLRRYVLLPLTLAAVVGSCVMVFYGDGTESLVGNIFASCLLWFLWKVRNRLGLVFGFG
ncbi:MAG: hypothetical protein PVI30_03990 [Myxococcales bacterium]